MTDAELLKFLETCPKSEIEKEFPFLVKAAKIIAGVKG